MESTHGWARAPNGRSVPALLASFWLGVGCATDRPLSPAESIDWIPAAGVPSDRVPSRATGDVEIVWPGGRGREVPPGEEKLAFAEFEAFPATSGRPPLGSFTYRVLNADSTPHREIVAVVSDAVVDVEQSKAWFVGEVVSDTKTCGGGSCDGHDGGGCGGGGTDGGCSDGTHDDGGCSGAGGDGTHDDGGCSGAGSDGTHDDGGCGGAGSEGAEGTPHAGGSIPGKNPRVGQIVVVKVHDVGTPGDGRDGIAWKWFAPGTVVDLTVEPKFLCKKEIIGGNVIVHPVPVP